MVNQKKYLFLSENEILEAMQLWLMSLPYKRRVYHRGDVIYQQGDPVEGLGYLLEGTLKCVRYTMEGEEVIPHYFYPLEIFPEYLILTHEETYIYTLVAEKTVELIFIKEEDLLEDLYSHPQRQSLLLSYLAHRGFQAEKWTLCNSYKTLKSKMAFMLLEIFQSDSQGVIQLIDKQEVIARKLQVSRSMYNQELAKLEKMGVIQKGKGTIIIIDAQYLEKLI
ncbi:Crp/Fnr family transcriptional regulator [Hutsoniella sourekii]|uniref:Crp/Fnr family transcriptional regulator n=1 Tax=Hutsoniella sourekii TaxID=87650 RepID=UPI00047FEDCC|nr:Crp/Fnr family transcriptional regulator [Hutsoniella sourekii]